MNPNGATAALAGALRTVPGIRVLSGLGFSVVPPAAIVGPPRLTWDGVCVGEGPTGGTWQVYVVASLTEFATAQLLELIGPVSAALEKHTTGVVRSALPGAYPAGQQGDLPSYLIEVEMELSS